MKRYLKLGLLALVGAATLSTAAMISQPQVAQAEPGQIFQELDLSEDQQDQIRAVFEDRRSEIEGILSEEQREQFFETLQEDRNFREAIAAADLTDTQREDVRAIMLESREEISEILTEEQQEELRELMMERRQQRR
ncbi:MAG: Spy/CpxP family protein refolding chaperone [Leptolyngbyaceae cyanobacterium]